MVIVSLDSLPFARIFPTKNADIKSSNSNLFINTIRESCYQSQVTLEIKARIRTLKFIQYTKQMESP